MPLIAIAMTSWFVLAAGAFSIEVPGAAYADTGEIKISNPDGMSLIVGNQFSGKITDLEIDDGKYLVLKSELIAGGENIGIPSHWSGDWVSPENAIASDNFYAYSELANNKEFYGGYEFQIAEGLTILKVEVGFEAHSPPPGNDVKIKISVDNGESWSKAYPYDLPASDNDELIWIDITTMTDWTPEKFSNLLINFTCIKNSPTYLDWIPVRITIDNQYALEAEFTGYLSATIVENLTWNFDASWSVSNVNATLQLYNYSSNEYSTGGIGYINWTSGPADTDELIQQSISLGASRFLSASNRWRLKLTASKAGNQFNLNADWIELQARQAGGLVEFSLNYSEGWPLSYFFLMLAFISLVYMFYLALLTLKGAGRRRFEFR